MIQLVCPGAVVACVLLITKPNRWEGTRVRPCTLWSRGARQTGVAVLLLDGYLPSSSISPTAIGWHGKKEGKTRIAASCGVVRSDFASKGLTLRLPSVGLKKFLDRKLSMYVFLVTSHYRTLAYRMFNYIRTSGLLIAETLASYIYFRREQLNKVS